MMELSRILSWQDEDLAKSPNSMKLCFYKTLTTDCGRVALYTLLVYKWSNVNNLYSTDLWAHSPNCLQNGIARRTKVFQANTPLQPTNQETFSSMEFPMLTHT